MTDPKKRAEYDAMRKGGVGFSSEYYRPGQGFDFFDSIFRDFFTDFPFGSSFFNRTATKTKPRGTDINLEVTLSLKDVVTAAQSRYVSSVMNSAKNAMAQVPKMARQKPVKDATALV